MHPETIVSHHFGSNSFRVHSSAFMLILSRASWLAVFGSLIGCRLLARGLHLNPQNVGGELPHLWISYGLCMLC